VKLAVDGGVIEARERGIELGNRGAERREQVRRLIGERCHRYAGQPGEQPHEMRPRVRLLFGDLIAVE
jgi:hypothetical protein